MTPRRSKTQWQQLIVEQAASGQSQKAFCEQVGIPLATFGYWKRKLQDEVHPEPSRSDSRTDSASLSDWIELSHPVPDERPAWQIELALGHGLCLRLRRG